MHTLRIARWSNSSVAGQSLARAGSWRVPVAVAMTSACRLRGLALRSWHGRCAPHFPGAAPTPALVVSRDVWGCDWCWGWSRKSKQQLSASQSA